MSYALDHLSDGGKYEFVFFKEKKTWLELRLIQDIQVKLFIIYLLSTVVRILTLLRIGTVRAKQERELLAVVLMCAVFYDIWVII